MFDVAKQFFLDMWFLTLVRTLGILGTEMPVTFPSEFIVQSLWFPSPYMCVATEIPTLFKCG